MRYRLEIVFEAESEATAQVIRDEIVSTLDDVDADYLSVELVDTENE